MYKNRGQDGKNNICGGAIQRARKEMAGCPSQRAFAEMLQIAGLDIDKNAVSRIELGSRFVTDIELKIIAEILHTTADQLLEI